VVVKQLVGIVEGEERGPRSKRKGRSAPVVETPAPTMEDVPPVTPAQIIPLTEEVEPVAVAVASN
jgi:hypothetical protein